MERFGQVAGQGYLTVQPGNPEQPPGLLPGTDQVQAAPVLGGRAGRAGQRPHPVASMKLTWSRSATSGTPSAARAASRSRNRSTVAMSISPATVTTTYPGPRWALMVSASLIAGHPPNGAPLNGPGWACRSRNAPRRPQLRVSATTPW
jgi:hypothetical protein